MSKRAERRHHYERLKEKVRREHYWGKCGEENVEEDIVAMAAETPKWCSCSSCMNTRRNKWLPRTERVTRQELKSEDSFVEQIDDYYE